jgi:hypothetical protein
VETARRPDLVLAEYGDNQNVFDRREVRTARDWHDPVRLDWFSRRRILPRSTLESSFPVE